VYSFIVRYATVVLIKGRVCIVEIKLPDKIFYRIYHKIYDMSDHKKKKVCWDCNNYTVVYIYEINGLC
ncbi:MAG: hypothetical protein WBM37_03430, partial [Nitrososphaeraceae archaeon]